MQNNDSSSLRCGDSTDAVTLIQGARVNNLRGIDCHIPLHKITVITGVSGSGKSSLAFDVLYAEGQRRYVECLSVYARQFLERLERPEVDRIGYIQPPIALKQRVNIRNARSTVGTITELTDHIRLLFTHAGQIHCTRCGGKVLHTGSKEAIKAIELLPLESRLAIVAPVKGMPDESEKDQLLQQGFVRLFVDGEVIFLDDVGNTPIKQPRGRSKQTQSTIGIVIDRIIVGKVKMNRVAESLRTAWAIGQGFCEIHSLAGGEKPTDETENSSKPLVLAPTLPLHLRRGTVCTECGAPGTRSSPGLFSWNSPIGACAECNGFGRVVTVDRNKVVPNQNRNLRNHAVAPFAVPSAKDWYRRMLRGAIKREIPTDIPYKKLTADQQDWIFAGDDSFTGVNDFFKGLEPRRYKMHIRIFLARYRGYVTCPVCSGARLVPEALSVTIGQDTNSGAQNIHDIHTLPISRLQKYINQFDPVEAERKGVSGIIANIGERLAYLNDVGVGYLSLGRSGRTLSGGETQRIRLAAALGSALTDTLYILDEPTIGLHASDTERMLRVMKRLTQLGNTVVVVEHDPGIISGADHLIVLGPGGGRQGGRIVYEGETRKFLTGNPGFFYAVTPGQITRASASDKVKTVKGLPKKLMKRKGLGNPWNEKQVRQWVSRHQKAAQNPPPTGPDSAEGGSLENRPKRSNQISTVKVRFPEGPALDIRGLSEHNLKIKRLRLPLSRLIAITGVSGSGKSTLLDETIYRNWLRVRGEAVEEVGAVKEIDGYHFLSEAHFIGQNLPGRSSRSNPISFIQAYPEIRKLLASTFHARQQGLTNGSFSFNTKGGRCETCKGIGNQTLEMYFLPDVDVTCEDCNGKRFRKAVLEIHYRKKNISDILNMTVDEAITFFRAEPKIIAKLTPLQDVGLGYIILGQSTSSLSGGEAQRLRLASFLAKSLEDERHLFLFDEPTTGLHGKDVEKLLRALRILTSQGHAVIVVEHHLDLIRTSDWVIDLGPGPGAAGGEIVFQGPFDQLVQHPTSATAQALREHLVRISG